MYAYIMYAKISANTSTNLTSRGFNAKPATEVARRTHTHTQTTNTSRMLARAWWEYDGSLVEVVESLTGLFLCCNAVVERIDTGAESDDLLVAQLICVTTKELGIARLLGHSQLLLDILKLLLH